MHKVHVLVNGSVKLAQEKSVIRTDRFDMTIAVDWDVIHQTKQYMGSIMIKFAKINWFI